jgi:lipoprotein-anchoring transpeptidase ErfK/SrfK
MPTTPCLALAVLLTQPLSIASTSTSAVQPSPAEGRPVAAAAADPDLAALQLQVMLDRAGFSPGVIDGRMGTNTERALALYQQHRGDSVPEGIPPLAMYTISDADTEGPFTTDVPADLMAQASLPALGYRSVLEQLAERFHATPELLQQLNPGAAFAAGELIQVPNVEPLVVPSETVHIGPGDVKPDTVPRPQGTTGARQAGDRPSHAEPLSGVPDAVLSRPDVVVMVIESQSLLTVTDTVSGQLVFAAPVSTGSEHDRLPVGEWTVTAIQLNPVFHYNPKLFWDADPSHSNARIPPGPNNPVGLVWIDLDKAHYGIHGTPEPAAIGRTQSHGCVRLTNWDAVRLAGLVKPGTKAVFTQ